MFTRVTRRIQRSPRLVTWLSALPYAPYRGSVIRHLDPGARTVLEAGIGRGNFLRLLRWRRPRLVLAGVDVWEPYVRAAVAARLAPRLAVADVRALPFADKSFDVALCIEVIEHLTMDQGAVVIAELERVARRQVIISTTAIPLDHEEIVQREHPADGNAHMVHQSEWEPQAFQRFGYTVRGMYPRGLLTTWDPVYFLSYLLPLQYLVYFKPEWARAWIATKQLT